MSGGKRKKVWWDVAGKRTFVVSKCCLAALCMLDEGNHRGGIQGGGAHQDKALGGLNPLKIKQETTNAKQVANRTKHFKL